MAINQITQGLDSSGPILNIKKEIYDFFLRRGLLPSRWTKSPTHISSVQSIMEASQTLLSKLDPLPSQAPKVIFFTNRCWPIHMAWESIIAWGLRLRGVNPFFVLCGGGMPACDYRLMAHKRRTDCSICNRNSRQYLDVFRLNHLNMNDYINESDMSDILITINEANFSELKLVSKHNLSLCDLARVPACRHIGRSVIPKHGHMAQAYRNYIATASVLLDASEKIIRQLEPHRIVVLNGLFIAERVMLETAVRLGVPLYTYERGYIKDTVRFAKGLPVNKADINHWGIDWKSNKLTTEQEIKLDHYLADRKVSKRSIVKYWPESDTDKQSISETLSITPEKKTIVMFSNVTWDSAVLEREICFSSIHEWCDTVIRAMAQQDEVDLVIRIHPGEVRVPGREKSEHLLDYIYNKNPNLPDCIKIVPPDSTTSSYSLIEMADLILVYTSTVGLEAALMGKPVILAANTHYRNKGFTYDPTTKDEFLSLLVDNSIMKSSPQSNIDLARRYAYHFFFSTMLDFDLSTEIVRGSWPIFNFTSLEDLLPGKNLTLDLICDGILHGTPIFADNQDKAGQNQ